ncbi:MAG: AGE family epimerase/isomerase [Bacteroidales bacterium]|jgi:N-acylglucosamine 2-epimerase|nr:AGE family epimerase/isomerase [Bacteroidales bacterium]MCI2122213.1 AGE family epimerase/isomerase [Bacteroidales bacterium]MCI2145775.1 AGE family epimerase/isomerase [Bacteroidales bacterium]
MDSSEKSYLLECRSRYLKDLKGNIMPFWMKHGLDRVNGGVYTCVDRDGTLMDPTKSVWFQGRFGFIAAYTYNNISKNPEWLEASRSCIDFIEKHCIDSDGHMFFTVTAEGAPVQKRRYVFSECFAAMAMAEYSKATGSEEYARKSLDMLKNIQKMLNTPGFLPPKTYVPGRSHSITMMLINVAAVIRQVIQDPDMEIQVDKSINDLAKYHMHQEFKALLENVGPEGEFQDTLAGRTINPGHCIETSWFILEESKRRGWDPRTRDIGLRIYDWAWNWGWDEPYGGIINFRDCRNFPPQDYSQDMKFWWPQCEAIIGSLYAYLATGDGKYLVRHKMAHDYTYRVFPDTTYGEWYGYLHRDGTVAQPAKGNIFKGPFHVPRMMVKASMLIEEILKNE